MQGCVVVGVVVDDEELGRKMEIVSSALLPSELGMVCSSCWIARPARTLLMLVLLSVN